MYLKANFTYEVIRKRLKNESYIYFPCYRSTKQNNANACEMQTPVKTNPGIHDFENAAKDLQFGGKTNENYETFARCEYSSMV